VVEENKKNDDEIEIDFSKIKNFFKKLKKNISEEDSDNNEEKIYIQKDEEKSDNVNENIKEVQEEANDVKEKIEEEIDKEQKHIQELKEKEKEVEEISTNLKYQEETKKEASMVSKNIDKQVKDEKEKIEGIDKKIKISKEEDSDDEINIDFSKIKNFFKKLKKNISEEDKDNSEEKSNFKTEQKKDNNGKETKDKIKEEKDDDELNIDFSKIKNTITKSVKSIFKGEDKKNNKSSSDEDEINVDWKKFSLFFQKNKYAYPALLILIAIFFSTFFRMYPAYLPVTDDWAENAVYNNIKSSIKTQINQQYPNLPDQNKNVIVDTQLKQILEQQKTQIDAQIQGTSNYFKTRLQDESGQTYLLAIDPYLWYGEARNYIRNGHFGTEIVDGKEINFLRNGRVGKPGEPGSAFHLYFEVFLYKLIHFFNRSATIMGVIFIIPVILIGLSIIPAFFIGRRVGGNIGGFFASMIIAINTALLSRTPAGFVDTDSYNIFFPLYIAWFFLEAFEAKSLKKQLLYASLSGLFIGLFSKAWGGWWYVFDFILVTIGIYFLYLVITQYKIITKKNSSFITNKSVKDLGIVGGMYFVTSMIFVAMFNNFNSFFGAISGPLYIITLKDVAVKTLWPNVLTTVAEFNAVPLGSIMAQMGGKLFFYIGIIGIILSIFKKDKQGKKDIKFAIFMIIWFIGTLYGFTKGIRFAILMVPAFAIAFGVAIGISYNYLSKWLSKELHINKYFSNTIIIILFLLLLISPIKAAHRTSLNEIPSMNDAWYESLTAIKNASEDAVTTSWWDFGHWFVAISERRVTFDGADQGERIHWVGKSLVTSNETQAVGILRMLNCGQEQAPHVLEKYLDNGTVKAIEVLNNIMLVNKKKAKEILESEKLSEKEIEDVLKVTHCDDLIDQYYIASEDMIGKAGVWGHFGSWDFKKAEMWQSVRKLDFDYGVRLLVEKYNYSSQQADTVYYEIINNDADRWVSPWPGYLSGQASCSTKNNIMICSNGVEVNLSNMKAFISTQQGKAPLKSLAFINDDKEFELKEYEGNTAPYSVALLPNGNSIVTDPLLVASMFTRMFFFDGHGLKHFKMFSDKTQISGGRIQVWNVSWNPNKPIVLPQFIEKTEVKEGYDINVYYIGWEEKIGVFDSSIENWRNLNITSQSQFNNYDNNELSFKVGSSQVIPGFDKDVIGMKINETKIIKINPEEGYGLDANAHPLGNKTLYFKIKIIVIK
jgi:dolichyl-phosphooligosaccharide-protein glycotransferase